MALVSIFSSSLLSLFFCFSTWPQCWIFLAIGSSATRIRENLRDKKEGERELLCALFDLSKELRWQGEQRKKRKMIKESKFSCKDIWKKSKDTGPGSAIQFWWELQKLERRLHFPKKSPSVLYWWSARCSNLMSRKRERAIIYSSFLWHWSFAIWWP